MLEFLETIRRYFERSPARAVIALILFISVCTTLIGVFHFGVSKELGALAGVSAFSLIAFGIAHAPPM